MKFLLLFLFSFTAMASTNDVDKAYFFQKNLLKNPGFENGVANWTASAGTYTVTTSSPNIGLQHANWDAAASADTLTSNAITVPSGMFGRTGAASCLFTTASGTSTHSIQVYDGTNILVSSTIVSNTTPTRTSVNFSFPSSGTVALRVYANANEPSIAIDDCFLGPSEGFNTSNVSQATVVGTATQVGAANCDFTQATSSGVTTYVDLGSAGSCAQAWTTTGIATVSGATSMQLTATMPPGVYEITLTGDFNVNGSATVYYRLTDGTSILSSSSISAGSAINSNGNLTGTITYTTTASHTFKVQAADNAGVTNGYINSNAGQQLTWTIKRFPTSSDTAYTPDMLSQSWSGYHDNTCSFARTNTAYGDPAADSTCGFTELTNNNFGTVTSYLSGSDKLPGIVFIPKRAGRYFACATAFAAASASVGKIALVDGATIVGYGGDGTSAANQFTTICGFITATSTASKTVSLQSSATSGSTTIGGSANTTVGIQWTIFSVDNQFPAPVLFTPRYARAHASSTSISGSLATIVWTTEDEDIDNTMSTSVYTAIDGGIYSVDCSLLIAATYAAGNAGVLEIQKNSSVFARSTINAGGIQTNEKLHVHDSIRLASGDTIRCQASSAATGPSIASSNFDNYISIVKIGN